MKKKDRTAELILAISSGILLGLSWPTFGFIPLIFVAFIPLLFLEGILQCRAKKFSWKLMRYSFITFLVFGVITTGWVARVSIAAGISTVILNATVMMLFFQLYHLIRVSVFESRDRGQWVLIPVWIAFEFLHYHWELNFPWLNLGNAFADSVKIIQWYDITGILGGTLWILISNVLLYKIARKVIKKDPFKHILAGCIATLLVIIVPIVISLIKYYSYEEQSDPVTVVVYQPNNDPFGEQYSLSTNQIIDSMFFRTEPLLGPDVDFILGPESALQDHTWEHELDNALYIGRIRKGLEAKAPNAAVVIGSSTYKLYAQGEPLEPTARQYGKRDLYYDAYNTELYIDTTRILQKHHKSRLTPGVERMPYIKYLPFIENFAMDLGGTVGSLGVDKEQKPFVSSNYKFKPAPLICYESIFGEYATKFIRNGANVIFISTNDGWWGNTQGYKQHCAYASLLAIETRRDIARSANTGTSCTINQRGDISNATGYWTPAAFKATINLCDKTTTYVKYGDYIAHVAVILLMVLTMITIINNITIRSIKMGDKRW